MCTLLEGHLECHDLSVVRSDYQEKIRLPMMKSIDSERGRMDNVDLLLVGQRLRTGGFCRCMHM